MAAQTVAPNLSMAQATQRHHHPRSQLAAPKDNEAVLAALKITIPETNKKALTGLAEFGNSRVSAGNNHIVHTQHHLTHTVIRVLLIVG
uniref:Uncharacterized protein n=1 Tax=Amphimedon queenslandica TaxID=400682 RepID=A0A1X7T7X7_AMPQE